MTNSENIAKPIIFCRLMRVFVATRALFIGNNFFILIA